MVQVKEFVVIGTNLVLSYEEEGNPSVSKNGRSSPCKFYSVNTDFRINALVFTPPPVTKHRSTPGLPLSGISVAVKDNICTASMPTSCSSLMLKEYQSPFDATVVRLLRSSGANIAGKANCDEFGMGSLNTYSIHGPVRNPFNPLEQRSAGGSSGGSAAAVAAGMCDAALGTDTGGSIRLPASYCGVIGFKPSYGLLSRWGVVSFADSLDCVGVLSKDMNHAEKIFDVLNVYDPKDPTAASKEIRQSDLDQPVWTLDNLDRLRIGIPCQYFPSELHRGVVDPLRRVLSKLKSLGATIKSVSLPSTPYTLSAYYVICSAEASSNLARYDGVQYGLYIEPSADSDKRKAAHVYAHSRSAGFGSEVKRRILLGTYALTADAFDNYFLQAQRVRQLVREDFNTVFRARNPLQSNFTPSADGVDVLLHPSAIRTAPPLDNTTSPGLDTYLQDVLTVPASLAGLPALSVPVGSGEDGWPVGVSLVSQWGRDKGVCSLGRVIETLCRQ